MSDLPGTPVQVVMPAALLSRLAEPLAAIGMRLYQLPTRGGPTLLVGADLSELRDREAPFTTQDVLDAWSLAAGLLAESAEANRPKTRKRKAPRNAA